MPVLAVLVHMLKCAQMGPSPGSPHAAVLPQLVQPLAVGHRRRGPLPCAVPTLAGSHTPRAPNPRASVAGTHQWKSLRIPYLLSMGQGVPAPSVGHGMRGEHRTPTPAPPNHGGPPACSTYNRASASRRVMLWLTARSGGSLEPQAWTASASAALSNACKPTVCSHGGSRSALAWSRWQRVRNSVASNCAQIVFREGNEIILVARSCNIT